MKRFCSGCGRRFTFTPDEGDEDPPDLCDECADELEAYAYAMTDSSCVACRHITGYCICEPVEVEYFDHPIEARNLGDCGVGHDVGDVLRLWVAAPGTGYNEYEIVAIASDGSTLAVLINSTVRELTLADVI